MTSLPLSRFDGYLRCIRYAELDEVCRDTIDFVCSQFFGRDTVKVDGNASNEAVMRELGMDQRFKTGTHEAPFAFRRFAGDASLPRSRYFTVAKSPQGDDGGALEAELSAYSDLAKAGPVLIHDAASGEIGILMYFWQFVRDKMPDFAEFARTYMGHFIFHFDYRDRPVSFDFADSHAIYTQAARRGHEFVVFVPTQVSRVVVEKCLDLRLPAARRALAELLTRDLPGIITCDKQGRLQPLSITSDAPSHARSETQSLSNEALFYGPPSQWEGGAVSLPPGLPRLLAYLTYGQRGGSPITDVIARHLRRSGVEAMVFPSARCDINVEMHDDAVHDWHGWNLVDYQGASMPHTRGAVIVEPQSWMNPLTGYRLSEAPAGSQLAGSFSLKGPTEGLHEYLKMKANENRGV